MKSPSLHRLPPLERIGNGEYETRLAAVQQRLAHIQGACIGRRRRAIIAVEGFDAAGKGGFIQRLTAPWDPRFFDVQPIRAPDEAERAHHYLWRFWQRLPAMGEVSVFDRTWYGRVLVERVEGFASEAEWQRAYDEINAFEKLLVDDGAVLIKLFFTVSQTEQDARLIERLQTPYKRWKVSAEDFRNRQKRDAYVAAAEAMFERTHTRWAPWTLIDGEHKKSARIAALTHVADRLSEGLDLSPPALCEDIARLARQAFGSKLNLS
jgi:polyphosphate kinase 2 (PPK2 family)